MFDERRGLSSQFYTRKRERVVDVSRSVASLFSSSRGDADVTKLVRKLVHLDLEESPVIGPPVKSQILIRKVPRAGSTPLIEEKVYEVLLAFLILRSIELELEGSSGEKNEMDLSQRLQEPLAVRVRRVEDIRSPSFRLPRSQAMLLRDVQAFCSTFLSFECPVGRCCLLTALDGLIPTTTTTANFRLTDLPGGFACNFHRKLSINLVASILAQWERRRVVILQRPSDHFKSDDIPENIHPVDPALQPYATVLKSVSRQGLTQALAQTLHELGLHAQRPIVQSQKSIYQLAESQIQSQPPPPPPPLPTASTDLPTGQLSNGYAIRKLLETPSATEVNPAFDYFLQDWTFDSLKSVVGASTADELLTKTFLIPTLDDPRFATIRFCEFTSKDLCPNARRGACKNLHYKKLMQPHTGSGTLGFAAISASDMSLGDCSYLDTCRHMFSCKFVHYVVDLSPEEQKIVIESPLFQHRAILVNQFDVLERSAESLKLVFGDASDFVEDDSRETTFEKGVIEISDRRPTPAQWIRCDLRSLDLGIFRGLVSVVMADPPWDIRMDLPYGTMTDHEMKHLRVDMIQDEGLLFLWVTGRAMEIARDCMTAWGYQRVDELVWVKTNHLHRIIRTGRTGHWLNHSKEHCLIGIKGNPKINRRIDCDVIVSEVRETSRKPDEIYRIIERISPDGLKLELFGRQHNLRQNWITLGNQLDGVSLTTPQLITAFRENSGGMRQVVAEETHRLERATKPQPPPTPNLYV